METSRPARGFTTRPFMRNKGKERQAVSFRTNGLIKFQVTNKTPNHISGKVLTSEIKEEMFPGTGKAHLQRTQTALFPRRALCTLTRGENPQAQIRENHVECACGT